MLFFQFWNAQELMAERSNSAGIVRNLESINRGLAEKIDDFIKDNPQDKNKDKIVDDFIKFTKNIEEIKGILGDEPSG
jgi:hypothetical protein